MKETDKIKELERLNKEYFYEIQGLRKQNKDLKSVKKTRENNINSILK